MDTGRLAAAIAALVALVTQLRGPGGCPWDAKQTDSSIKLYLLEEAYEVLEAVEKKSPREVCRELGDLLFQILFLSELAAERGEFDFIEVVEEITKKMTHRHPHVFGKVKVNSAEDVAANWAMIKKAERGAPKGESSAFDSVPRGLPAMLRAHRIGQRAAHVGFDWPSAKACWQDIKKNFESVEKAFANGDKGNFLLVMGDLLFSLASFSRHLGYNSEHLLRLANERFAERFTRMESQLEASGVDPYKASPEQVRRAWKDFKVQ